jgi:hypothetical protein
MKEEYALCDCGHTALMGCSDIHTIVTYNGERTFDVCDKCFGEGAGSVNTEGSEYDSISAWKFGSKDEQDKFIKS